MPIVIYNAITIYGVSFVGMVNTKFNSFFITESAVKAQNGANPKGRFSGIARPYPGERKRRGGSNIKTYFFCERKKGYIIEVSIFCNKSDLKSFPAQF